MYISCAGSMHHSCISCASVMHQRCITNATVVHESEAKDTYCSASKSSPDETKTLGDTLVSRVKSFPDARSRASASANSRRTAACVGTSQTISVLGVDRDQERTYVRLGNQKGWALSALSPTQPPQLSTPLRYQTEGNAPTPDEQGHELPCRM